MSLLDEFSPATRTRPCPICERTKFCLIDRGSRDDPSRVVCTKVESQRRWGDAGWLHILRHDGRRNGARFFAVAVAIPGGKFGALASRFEAAMTPERIHRIAAGLGLTAGSLTQLGVGATTAAELERLGTPCRSAGCWTFPMRAGDGAVVGIRLRTPEGYKYAVRGSKQGLFIPPGLRDGARLLIAEGPTDTAALIDLGYETVGRPSCEGGIRHVVALVRRRRPRSAIVVADADEPGLRGATALASVLVAYVAEVRVIRPPDGLKDARAWKNALPNPEAAAAQVNQAIEAAVPHRLSVRVTKSGTMR